MRFSCPVSAMIFGIEPRKRIFPPRTRPWKSRSPLPSCIHASYGPSNLKSAGTSDGTALALTFPPTMSRRNDAFRSMQVNTIFAVTVVARFAHSGSALRRLATSSKNVSEKYWTIKPSRPREVSEVGKRLCRFVAASIPTGKVLRGRTSRGSRVGSQARSKARDSRSLPEGVPRFESWPTHRTHSYHERVQRERIPGRGVHEPVARQGFLKAVDDAEAGVCDETKRADRLDDDAGR